MKSMEMRGLLRVDESQDTRRVAFGLGVFFFFQAKCARMVNVASEYPQASVVDITLMAFDKAGNYYRYARENGKVRRIYLGRSEAALAAAASDREERQARERESLKAREVKQNALATQQAVIEFGRLAQSIVWGALIVSGYRRSLGGNWKRRGRRKQ